jgi:glycylpeptide N-tetradecanoyltransferase
MTVSRAIKLYALPAKPSNPNLRPMEAKDVHGVFVLLGQYLSRFAIAPVFTEDEIAHWLLPRPGVVSAYVVEDPASHGLTGVTSFYSLPSTVIGHPRHKVLNAAYAFYSANTRGTVGDLVKDALVLAKSTQHDVFNCLDLMENESFIKDLKFGVGDGSLHYYLYNWVTPPISPKQLGLVLL